MPVSAAATVSLRDDALAYAVLERARLACERPEGGRSPTLRLAQRHLGLAGYHASEHLLAELRRELLAAAHGASARYLPPTQDAGEDALLLARHGADVVARCLRNRALSEQMHLVHVQVLDAVDTLVTRVGPRRARALNDLARRSGQFDPLWQRTNLAAAPAGNPARQVVFSEER